MDFLLAFLITLASLALLGAVGAAVYAGVRLRRARRLTAENPVALLGVVLPRDMKDV